MRVPERNFVVKPVLEELPSGGSGLVRSGAKTDSKDAFSCIIGEAGDAVVRSGVIRVSPKEQEGTFGAIET